MLIKIGTGSCDDITNVWDLGWVEFREYRESLLLESAAKNAVKNRDVDTPCFQSLTQNRLVTNNKDTNIIPTWIESKVL